MKAGQVLARLDPADYQLAVKAAADQVQAASVDAQQSASDEARFHRLLADGSVGTADHERQKARADAAAARLCAVASSEGAGTMNFGNVDNGTVAGNTARPW